MPYKNIEDRKRYMRKYASIRACAPLINDDAIRAMYSYDGASGLFYRKDRKFSQVAGKRTTDGHKQVWVRGRLVQAHRLAWFLFYGEWPPTPIDHINGNPADNRIANLRLATVSQNQHNSKLRKDNTSGHKGVSYLASKDRWIAYLNYRGKRVFTGTYRSQDEAVAARRSVSAKYFGRFMHKSEKTHP